MKEFSKITNPADVLDTQHFLQLNKIFLIHQNDNNQTNACSCAASCSRWEWRFSGAVSLSANEYRSWENIYIVLLKYLPVSCKKCLIIHQYRAWEKTTLYRKLKQIFRVKSRCCILLKIIDQLTNCALLTNEIKTLRRDHDQLIIGVFRQSSTRQ